MDIGIIIKHDSEEALRLAHELVSWLKDRQMKIRSVPELAEELGVQGLNPPDLGQGLDLMVVLGGDGTLLHAASLLGNIQVPVMGVNLGGLGYLTEITKDEMFSAVQEFISGKAKIRERMMIKASLGSNKKTYRALNEFTITIKDLPRLIQLETYVDGFYVTSFRSDGLIISTPTGSTAYCLSAGGPIVHPAVDCIILTPIAPHTLTSRPLVVPRKSMVKITLGSAEKGGRLIVDGRRTQPLGPGDSVHICAADKGLLLVRSSSKTYYEILRTKLHWGEL